MGAMRRAAFGVDRFGGHRLLVGEAEMGQHIRADASTEPGRLGFADDVVDPDDGDDPAVGEALRADIDNLPAGGEARVRQVLPEIVPERLEHHCYRCQTAAMIMALATLAGSGAVAMTRPSHRPMKPSPS